jgi:hypothetical protein
MIEFIGKNGLKIFYFPIRISFPKGSGHRRKGAW